MADGRRSRGLTRRMGTVLQLRRTARCPQWANPLPSSQRQATVTQKVSRRSVQVASNQFFYIILIIRLLFFAPHGQTNSAPRRRRHYPRPLRRSPRLFLRKLQLQSACRAWDYHAILARQSLLVHGPRHHSRAPFPGTAPRAGQAGALRAWGAF